MVRKDVGYMITERNIENELMDIKRDISSLRDKAVSAKAVMTNAETQIKEHLLSLSQLIEEPSREEFNKIAETLQGDLSSPEKAEAFVAWIKNYSDAISQKNITMIDKLKADVENWKQITG